jgi:ribosome-associated protein
MSNEPGDIDRSEHDEGPSKSQLKRDADALQKVGEELITLREDVLAGMDLPDPLAQAVHEARRIKSRGGLKRQRQYIGKLMRDIDSEAVIRQLDAIRHRHERGSIAFQKLERWRDRLVNDGADAVTAILDEHPALDAQHLNQLVRQARKEAADDKPPAAARKLFRYLREMIGD